jgi:uncharacterized protein YggU (UPF0235/DUF167 family)
LARITVRLTPRGGRNAIEGFGADGRLRVRVAAPPADGAANEAQVRLLADTLGVPASHVTIVAGASARLKLIEVAGWDDGALRDHLRALP